MDDRFVIKIKPVFDFKIDDIFKKISKIQIPPIKLNIDEKELQKSLSQIKDLKIQVGINFNAKNITNEINSFINNFNKDIISDVKAIQIPISLDLQASEKDIQKYQNELQKKINNQKKPITTSDDLLYSSIKKKEDSEDYTTTTKIKKDLLETIKEIKKVSFDKQGIETVETTIEKIKDYQTTSVSLYKQLRKEEKELSDLQQRRIKDETFVEKGKFDEAIKQREQRIALIKDEIINYGLTNKKLEEELALLKQIEELKTNVKKGKQEQNLQKILYQQLTKEEKELLRLEENSKKSVQNKTFQDYGMLIDSQQKVIDNIREEIKSRGLSNDELEEEIELIKKKSQLLNDVKDENRKFKIGKEITDFSTKDLISYKKSETSDLTDFVNTFLNQRGIEGQLEGITSLKEKIYSVNNAQKEFIASVKTGQGQVTDFSFAIDKNSNSVFELGSKIRRVNHTIAGFGSLLGEMVEKVAQWNFAVNLFYGTLDFASKGFEFFKQIDTDLTQVALVTNQTREQVEALKEEYISLSKETKRTISDISAINAELVRQGLTATESKERLETILKLSSVGGQSPEESLRLITSSVNSLQEDAKKTADVMVLADNISASSLDGIGKSLQKVGVTSKTVGLNLEQTVGIISTLSDVTQEAPETLGNSVRSILARFSRVDSEGKLNEDLNDIQKAVENIGVAFVDSNGEMRNFYDIMNDLAKVWDNLSKNERSSLGTTIAGSYQLNRFLVLIENWEKVQDITNTLTTSSTGTLDTAFSLWKNSIQAEVNETISLFQEFWLSIFNEESIKLLLNNLQIIIKFFARLETRIPILSHLIVGSLTLWILKFLNLKVSIKDVVASVKSFGVSVAKTTNDLKSNNLSLKENLKLLKQKIKENKELAKSEKSVSASIKKDTGKTDGATTQGVMQGSKLVQFAKGGLAGLAVGFAVDFLLSMINKVIGSIDTSGIVEEFESIVSSIKDLSNASNDEIKTLESLKDRYEKYREILGDTNDLTRLSTSEKKEYLDITQKIADIAPEVVSYWDLENGAMLEYGTTIDKIIEKKKELYKASVQQKKVEFQELFNKDIEGILEQSTWKKQEILNRQYDLLTYGDTNFSFLDKILNTINKFFNVSFRKFDETDISDPFSESKFKKRYEDYEKGYGPKPFAYIETLKSKLASASEEELPAINQEIQKIETFMQQLNAEKEVSDKILKDTIQNAKTIINLDLNDYFQSFGDSLSSLDRKAILDTASMYLEEMVRTNPSKTILEDTEAMAKSLIDIISDLKFVLQDVDTEDLVKDETVEKLKELEDRIAATGISSNGAKDAINFLAFAYLELGESAEKASDKILQLKSNALSNFKKIEEYQQIMNKASNKGLTAEDALNFIEDNPEVLDKINQGLETNVAIQEIALEKIKELNQETEKNINLQNQNLKDEKERLLGEKEKIQNTLALLEKKGDVDTSSYRKLSEDLEKLNMDLLKIDETTEKNNKELSAYGKIFNDIFSTNYLDEQLQSSIRNIQTYTEMLNSLNEKGITYDLQQQIINQYPYLIGYLNDEIGLRDILMQMLAKEEEMQKDSYNKKILYSTQFANAFMKQNTQMINDLASKYNIDLTNFASIQEQKLALLDGMNQAVYESNRLSVEYASMSANQLAEEYKKASGGLKIDGSLAGPVLNPEKSELIKELYKYQLALEKHQNIQIKPPQLIKPSTVGSSSRKGSKSPSTSTKMKKRKIELVQLEKEVYLKLNKELEKNNRLTEKNAKLLDYAFGEDKIKLMNKEIELLTQRQKLDNQLANKYREEQKKLKEELSKSFIMKDDGFDGFISFISNKEKEINNLITQINKSTNESTTESLTEQKDKIQKQVDDISNKYKRYIEITFSTIPDLQDDYMEQVFKKFDSLLKMMSVRLEDYSQEIGRLNVLKDLRVTGKRDELSELEYELKLHKEITQVYSQQIPLVKKNVDVARENFKKIEETLSKIKDKNSQDYKNNETNMILAKKQLNEAISIYETALQSYADSLNSKVQTEISLLEKLKEKAKTSLNDLRKDFGENSLFSYENAIKEIELALKKMDGIFISNAKVDIDTGGVYDEIKDANKVINTIRKNTEKWKNALDKVKNSTENHKEALEEIEGITKELITLENNLKEQILKKNEEIANQRLEYQEIEDALQHEIDLKQEALDKLEEEKKQEEDLLSLLKKRLALLGTLDDRSHMYITGQGTVEYTYDKSEVNRLLQEIAELEREKEYESKREELQAEIDKMVEDLNKTKEIHQSNLAVNEAQLEQMKKEQEYLSSLIESSMELFDNKFDAMIDKYIDSINEQFRKNTDTLLNIYDLLKNSQILSKGFEYANVKTRTIQANKGDKTLSDVAKRYNLDLNTLLKLNKELNANSKLKFGQNIKIPAFDTGGYTGNFNGGKLAILHQKELVLNPKDTQNILSAVETTRSLFEYQGQNQGETFNIHIGNISLPSVNNTDNFINNISRLSRSSIGRLN